MSFFSEVYAPQTKAEICQEGRKRLYTVAASGDAALPAAPMTHKTHNPDFVKFAVMAAWISKIPLFGAVNVS